MIVPGRAAGAAENIGPRERRKRLFTGVVALAVGLSALAVLVAADVPRAWRLLLSLPFWLAALGWFQARART